MFTCTKCDAQHPKWGGRCTECGAWGTLVEETTNTKKEARAITKARATVIELGKTEIQKAKHAATSISELDRVLGGGFVPGAVVLLAGEPGVGKSTLIGQLAKHTKQPIVLSSGEESPSQIQMRLSRLGVDLTHVNMVQETTVESLATAVENLNPSLAVVDSIQTASTLDVDGLPGSQSQVRASAVKLVELAKRSNIPILMVGQITKDGSVAGPKMLEHLVDVVLHMEGDDGSSYRILRAMKNRFGSTDEVGIFEMTSDGLTAVPNPSERFLAERTAGPGSVVTCIMEGNRPLLVEVQALVDKTSYGHPVRRAHGFDLNRLQLLIAIANRHANAHLEESDVYVNVVGGLKLREPSVDLAVLMALLSAKRDAPVPDAVVIGEVGLGGEVRRVPFLDRRLAEADRFGMKQGVIPNQKSKSSLSTRAVKRVSDLYSK